MNRAGLLTIGSTSCLALFLSAVSLCAGETDDGRPLILELRRDDLIQRENSIQLECQVTVGVDFFAGTTVNGIRWTVRGNVKNVADGVVTLDAVIESHAESATQPRTSYQGMQLKIDDVQGVHGGFPVGGVVRPGWHFWIRRGFDPLPAVRSCLTRRDDSFWAAADYVEHLGTAGRAAIPELLDALRSDSEPAGQPPYQSFRGRAAQTLGKIGPQAKEAVPALVAALQDPNGYVHVDAAVALWRIAQQRDTWDALIAATKDEEWGVRHHAVVGLGEIATPEHAAKAVPVLLEALNDENDGVRLQACYSLAKFKAEAKPALPALREARNDENKDVRQAVAYALEQIEK